MAAGAGWDPDPASPSTVVVPTATVYPDSDKVGVWTGDPEADVIVHRESKVDYFDGEA